MKKLNTIYDILKSCVHKKNKYLVFFPILHTFFIIFKKTLTISYRSAVKYVQIFILFKRMQLQCILWNFDIFQGNKQIIMFEYRFLSAFRAMFL